MGFDIFIENEWEKGYDLSEFPLLATCYREYVPRCSPLPLVDSLRGETDLVIEPAAFLAEIDALAEQLAKCWRPFAAPPAGLRVDDLFMLKHERHLVGGDAQIVAEWSQFGSIDKGFPRMHGRHAIVLATDRRLHLVAANINEVKRVSTWRDFFHISASEFSWREDRLYVDRSACNEAPRPFRRDCLGWGEVRVAKVPVSAAWTDVISEARRACRRAIIKMKPLVVSS